jgi:hypothetical protein
VRSARSSIRAIATAPPTAPATKPTISLERAVEEGNCTTVYVGGSAPLHQKETGGRSESAPPVRRAGISAYFRLSSVRSKASFATTVEPHQLDSRPTGLTCET